MSPKDIVALVNVAMGNAWLLTSCVLYATGHWVWATVAFCMGCWVAKK
ncbi:MAG TPA: hypothetical protein VJS16_01485 [Gammaproteobacteria bacterium]|nr:hypothetical protein [Gammaproteobacteria bacterium]